mmetsp:Transcript_55187/g.164274  ORF Transcript_55187/g.164274 Transcript_55187/m.164274 type:complete len:320 (-) Transcript_55187:2062-3021(-)
MHRLALVARVALVLLLRIVRRRRVLRPVPLGEQVVRRCPARALVPALFCGEPPLHQLQHREELLAHLAPRRPPIARHRPRREVGRIALVGRRRVLPVCARQRSHHPAERHRVELVERRLHPLARRLDADEARPMHARLVRRRLGVEEDRVVLVRWQRGVANARVGHRLGAGRRLRLGDVRTEGLHGAEARAAAAAAAEARTLGHVRLHVALAKDTVGIDGRVGAPRLRRVRTALASKPVAIGDHDETAALGVVRERVPLLRIGGPATQQRAALLVVHVERHIAALLRFDLLELGLPRIVMALRGEEAQQHLLGTCAIRL